MKRLAILPAILWAIIACRVDGGFVDQSFQTIRCDTNGYFVRNLCDDERKLLERAEAFSQYPTLADLNRETLRELTQTTDVDFAAAVFYTRVLRDAKNRRFYEYLDR